MCVFLDRYNWVIVLTDIIPADVPVLPGEIAHFVARTMSRYRSCDAPGIVDQYMYCSIADSWSLVLMPRMFVHDMNFGKYEGRARAHEQTCRTIVYVYKRYIDILKKYIGVYKIDIITITKRGDLNIETRTFHLLDGTWSLLLFLLLLANSPMCAHLLSMTTYNTVTVTQ